MSAGWKKGGLPPEVRELPCGPAAQAMFDSDPDRFAAYDWFTRASKAIIRLQEPYAYPDQVEPVYGVESETPRPPMPREEAHLRACWPDDASDYETNKAFIDALLRFPAKPASMSDRWWSSCKHGVTQNSSRKCREITEKFLRLGFDRTLEEMMAPINSTKQMGHNFRAWLHGAFDTVDTWEDLQQSRLPITVLACWDSALKQIAAENLAYTGKKGLDLVAKVYAAGREIYVIAETKWVSEMGGGQSLSLADGMRVKSGRCEHEVRVICVLDGAPLYDIGGDPDHKVRSSRVPVVSCVLLPAYFRSLINELVDLRSQETQPQQQPRRLALVA